MKSDDHLTDGAKLIFPLPKFGNCGVVNAGYKIMMSQFAQNIIVGLAGVVISAGAAVAGQPMAQAEFMSGKIMLNSGYGFLKPGLNAQFFAGDKVLIGKNSSLTLAFIAAKCSVTYSEATVVVVPAKPSCKVGERIAAVNTNFVAPANGRAVAPVFTTFAGTSVPVTVGLSFSLTVFAIAGATQLVPLSAP